MWQDTCPNEWVALSSVSGYILLFTLRRCLWYKSDMYKKHLNIHAFYLIEAVMKKKNPVIVVGTET